MFLNIDGSLSYVCVWHTILPYSMKLFEFFVNDSLNSLNRNKAHNWNGYQECPMSGNNSIFRREMKFLLLCLDSYLLVWLVALVSCPEVVMKMYFLLLLPGM